MSVCVCVCVCVCVYVCVCVCVWCVSECVSCATLTSLSLTLSLSLCLSPLPASLSLARPLLFQRVKDNDNPDFLQKFVLNTALGDQQLKLCVFNVDSDNQIRPDHVIGSAKLTGTRFCLLGVTESENCVLNTHPLFSFPLTLSLFRSSKSFLSRSFLSLTHTPRRSSIHALRPSRPPS